jgi:hypothetical protein
MTGPLALSLPTRIGRGSLALWALAGLAVLLAAFARQPSATVAADDALTAAEQGLDISFQSARAVAEGYEVRIRLAETAGSPALIQASLMQLSGTQGALCPVAAASPLVRLSGNGVAEAVYVFPFRECYEAVAVAQSVKLSGRLQIIRDGQVQDLRLRLSRDAADD